MKKTSVYIIIALFITSCGASKNNSAAQNDKGNYKKLAVEKLGESITYSMNEAESYVLCMSEVKGTVKQPRNQISYVIIRVDNNRISLEDKIDGGTVRWYNEKMIEVFRTPGIMRGDQTRDDFITLYNVETGNSYPKNLKETH